MVTLIVRQFTVFKELLGVVFFIDNKALYHKKKLLSRVLSKYFAKISHFIFLLARSMGKMRTFVCLTKNLVLYILLSP